MSLSRKGTLKVAELESIIDYTFADKMKGWEALQLPGNSFATSFITNGNKRLAIVGDLAIDLVLSETWYASGAAEAAWTSCRLQLSSNASLAKVGQKLGIERCIQQSLTSPQKLSPKMMATAVEAVVGAVYLDCGRDPAVVKTVLTKMGIVAGNAKKVKKSLAAPKKP